MLKVMRENAKWFYGLFFIVILSFVFWGVGTVDKSADSTIVAEIDGYKISYQEYGNAYDRMLNFYRDIYKEKFDDEMQKKLKLKERVLNSLIDDRVLAIAARKNGIKVSDDELNEAIKSERAFMRNGSFDSEVYQNTLRLNRLTPEAYESAKREELTAEKMRRLIELAAPVPQELPAEITAGKNEQAAKALRDAMLNSEKASAVQAYIDGLKKGLKIKIYSDRLA